MAWTEKDLEKQMAEFEQIKVEFAKLVQQEEDFKKAHSIKDEDIRKDLSNLTDEEKKIAKYLKNEAEKAGNLRVASANQNTSPSSKAGMGRKGIIRL